MAHNSSWTTFSIAALTALLAAAWVRPDVAAASEQQFLGAAQVDDRRPAANPSGGVLPSGPCQTARIQIGAGDHLCPKPSSWHYSDRPESRQVYSSQLIKVATAPQRLDSEQGTRGFLPGVPDGKEGETGRRFPRGKEGPAECGGTEIRRGRKGYRIPS